MKKFRSKSVLYHYLVSFISIVMFSCTIIGIASYLTAAKELRTSAETEQRKRLQLAAEDLNAQFEMLQEISHRVQISPIYLPSNLKLNPYNEVELLEDFRKYNGYSSLYTYYFLHYKNSEVIYTPSGKSYPLEYIEALLDYPDSAELMSFVNTCRAPSFYIMPKGLMVIFPIALASTQDYNGRATINFYISNETLHERLELVSGEAFDRVAIYYNDVCIVDCGEITHKIVVNHERFTLNFDKDEIAVNVTNHFFHISLSMILLLALFLCALAVIIALRSYRPIGHLAKRHNLQTNGNELEYLDKKLVHMEGQLLYSQEQLDERMMQFKQLHDDLQHYFVMQIVHGEINEMAFNRMREIGMRFPSQTFYAFVVHLSENKEQKTFEQAIYELSDNNAAFYAVPFDGEYRYAVIVNTDADEGLRDILQEACADARVFGGNRTDVIREIPSLLFDALTESAPSCIQPTDIARCREDERLQVFRKALENGDETQALQSLNEYFHSYSNSDQTIRQLIHNNIIAILLGVSYEADMSVPHAFLRGKFQTWTQLEGWVSAICRCKENLSAKEENDVIHYLQEHKLDFNLSLENVAEHFHRSARHISRIVQAKTGSSYRDFVLQLRMEHAKEMLRNGSRVSDVCEAVCYVSRSHFIKVFTQYTGMTPSRYREKETKGTLL